MEVDAGASSFNGPGMAIFDEDFAPGVLFAFAVAIALLGDQALQSLTLVRRDVQTIQVPAYLATVASVLECREAGSFSCLFGRQTIVRVRIADGRPPKASSEIAVEPLPASERLRDYTERVELAVNFRVTVESPLPPPASQVQQQVSVPKERRILLGLMEALARVRMAHDEGHAEALVADREHRINANICEALLDMKPDADDAVLDLEVNWSATWPLPGRAPRWVSFESRSFETIAAVARALRTGEESQRRPWQGKVVTCAAEDPLQADGAARVIKIRVENHGTPLRIEVRLAPEDYRRAVQAHLQGKSVQVVGILEKSGKKAVLIEPSQFHVVE